MLPFHVQFRLMVHLRLGWAHAFVQQMKTSWLLCGDSAEVDLHVSLSLHFSHQSCVSSSSPSVCASVSTLHWWMINTFVGFTWDQCSFVSHGNDHDGFPAFVSNQSL